MAFAAPLQSHVPTTSRWGVAVALISEDTPSISTPNSTPLFPCIGIIWVTPTSITKNGRRCNNSSLDNRVARWYYSSTFKWSRAVLSRSDVYRSEAIYWRSLEKAFADRQTSTEYYIPRSGICSAFWNSDYFPSRSPSVEMVHRMRRRMVKHAPAHIRKLSSNQRFEEYWWPKTMYGWKCRESFCRKLAKECSRLAGD